MALERKDIERSDFPTARRGYDRAAVDAHLRKVAEQLDELSRRNAKPADTLATGASEHVRQIVAAAEGSAAEIKAEAEREAEALRDTAAAEAREHVARVSEAARALTDGIGAMEAELRRLVEGLEAELGSDDAALAREPETTPVPEPSPAPQPTPAPAEPGAEADGEVDDVGDRAVDAEPDEAPAEEPAMPDGGDDSEGARLIALNMALNGSPRDETDRYLAEHFNLDDREAMLEEVYARVGG
ncbi:MAG: DivIVA domain-containing protein [Solirubrobacteraceae bacterium]